VIFVVFNNFFPKGNKMRKSIVVSTLAICVSMLASSASAAIVFSDDFNRNNSNTVGNSWVELGNGNSDVAIVNSRLQLRDELPGNPDAAATQISISTADHDSISLDYSWAALTTSESDDYLQAAWKLSSATTWTNLVAGNGHGLGGNGSFSSASYSLGNLASNTSIDIRFWTDVSNSDEGALIDWVSISGDKIPVVAAVPEPASIALLGLGLLGVAAMRRRKMPV